MPVTFLAGMERSVAPAVAVKATERMDEGGLLLGNMLACSSAPACDELKIEVNIRARERPKTDLAVHPSQFLYTRCLGYCTLCFATLAAALTRFAHMLGFRRKEDGSLHHSQPL